MIKKFKPQSPDPFLNKIKGDTEFARFAHLNNLVDQINNSVPTLNITADGSIGASSIQFQTYAIIPPTFSGLTALPLQSIPAIALTNPSIFTATNIEFPTLTYAISIVIQSSTALTRVSAPLLISTVSGLDFSNNTNLDTINFPNLISVGGNLNLYNNDNLGDAFFPNLVSAIAITISRVSNTPLNVDFSSLESVGTLTLDTYAGLGPDIDNTKFPVLKTAGLNLTDVEIVNIDLQTLETLNSLSLSSLIESVNLPNVITMNGYFLSISSNTLTSFTLGTVGTTKKWQNSPFIDLSSCPLDEASVDNVLLVLASLDGTNGTTSCDGGYLQLAGTCAPPSTAGNTAVVTLLSRGWTVATN